MSIEHRTEGRTATALEGIARIGDTDIACQVRDISSHGAKIVSDTPLEAGAMVSLTIAPFGSLAGEVMWHRDNASGIKFNGPTAAVEQILVGLASYAMV